MRLAIWVVVLGCGGGFGQTFEVASIRPSAPVPPRGGVYFGPPRGGPGTSDPGRITWSYATLRNMLMKAYGVEDYQITGPAWLASERFDVAVKIGESATREQVAAMWQNLLAERFGVRLHHDPKEFRVEELVIASGGHKLTEVPEDLSAPPGPPQLNQDKLTTAGFVTMVEITGAGSAHALSIARAQPLSKLTEMLTNQLHRPVLDKTGLTGHYDFRIEFTPNMAGVPPPLPGLPPSAAAGAGPADNASDPGPELAGALQKQLGLKLVASRAKLDVVVIDKAEKVPTEN